MATQEQEKHAAEPTVVTVTVKGGAVKVTAESVEDRERRPQGTTRFSEGVRHFIVGPEQSLRIEADE